MRSSFIPPAGPPLLDSDSVCGVARMRLRQSVASPVLHPLDPPDLSSPESTINTFLTEATAAIEAYYAGDRDEMEARADRAFQTLEIPLPKNDAEFLQAAESTLYLLELLSRVELPPARAIPGPGLRPDEMPRYWTIPHTELVLERFDSESGEPLGYRFSAESVERLPEFYQRAQELSVKKRSKSESFVSSAINLAPSRPSAFAQSGYAASIGPSSPFQTPTSRSFNSSISLVET